MSVFRNARVRGLTRGASVAAVYAAACLLLQPLSYGPVQLRFSEVLCVLPLFWPEAVPGLFLGCLLANLLGGAGLPDVVFGSLATLLAALCTRRLRRWPFLALTPPVVVNALVIPLVLRLAFATPFWATAGLIAVSQAVVCLGLGYPLSLGLRRLPWFTGDEK